MSGTLSSSESRLIELKAKVEELGPVRERLMLLKARYVGTFRQVDTYFDVPNGRLKLREIKGIREAELIYYERENLPGPKRSSVFILRIRKPETFKALFDRVLKKKVIVDKRREVYRYRGTQIHLDTVEGLGTFIEFERKIRDFAEAVRGDKQVLEELMKKIGIAEKNLITGSYSDLLSSRRET